MTDYPPSRRRHVCPECRGRRQLAEGVWCSTCHGEGKVEGWQRREYEAESRGEGDEEE